MTPDSKIRNEIALLSAASRQELLARWQDVFGVLAPPQLSTQLLRSGLIHQIQVGEFGDLLPAHKRVLLQVSGSSPSAPLRRLKPGARLVREWNGIAHTVDVIDSGFRYRDRTYPSLTAIATEITGAHWSGPRFFGMRAKS